MSCVTSEPTPRGEAQPWVAPVGEPLGEPTEVVIGSDGGTLVAGPVTVTVPPGAVPADTTFSATPIRSTAPAALGDAIRLGPDLDFAEPLRVTFTYTEDQLAGTAAEALLIGWQLDTGVWAASDAPELDPAEASITVETDHLSDWSLVAGASLRPGAATVKVGASLDLEVQQCWWPDPAGLLGYECGEIDGLYPLPTPVRDWSVNGVTGGAGSTGTIAGDHRTATYAAPQQKPSPDVVAVSAELDPFTRTPAKVLLVSNVRVVDDEPTYLVEGSLSDRTLIAPFVEATLTDGFRFLLPWSAVATYGLELEVENLESGASNVSDIREDCIQPVLHGPFDALRVDRAMPMVTMAVLVGTRTLPDYTVGIGEGDCGSTTEEMDGSVTDETLLVPFPIEFFTSTDPPPGPFTLQSDAWVITITRLQN
ncbi:MAG: hypothetical protein ABMA64_05885 [Myxococcota bacterium]